MISFADFKMI